MRGKPISAVVGAVCALSVQAVPAMETQFWGHINRAVMWADDGAQSYTFNVDSAVAHSLVEIYGTQQIRPELEAGIRFSIAAFSNSSDLVTQDTASTGDRTRVRIAEATLRGPLGKLSLGKGESATHGLTELDALYTGSALAIYSAATDFGGNLKFRDSTTGAFTAVTPYDVVWEMGGMGKVDRVRYDFPPLGPIAFSVSHGTDIGLYFLGKTFTDVAARLAVGLEGGSKIAANLGYVVLDTESSLGNMKSPMAAVSFMSHLGVSVSVATCRLEYDDGSLNSRWQYIKLGFDSGNHHVAVDYSLAEDQLGEDISVKGTKGSEAGIGYVYEFAKGIRGYTGYKFFSVNDHPTARFDDLKVFFSGLYIRF